MKKRFVLFLLCGFALIFISGCQLSLPFTFADFMEAAQREQQTTTSPMETITPTVTPQPTAPIALIEVSRYEESEEFNYTIEMLHPQLENGGDSGEAFNQLLNNKLLTSVNEFREFAEERNDEMSAIGGISYYAMNYSVYRFDESFISLQFFISTYYIGAVHPGTQHFVVNYDLENEQEINFGDLFLPDSRILEVLQYYCAAELAAQFPDGYFENGLEPHVKNYEDWNLTAMGLLLTFEEYQVQAYAAGPQSILVPYEVLQPYIDPAGPLGFLTQQPSNDSTF